MPIDLWLETADLEGLIRIAAKSGWVDAEGNPTDGVQVHNAGRATLQQPQFDAAGLMVAAPIKATVLTLYARFMDVEQGRSAQNAFLQGPWDDAKKGWRHPMGLHWLIDPKWRTRTHRWQ